MPVRMSEEQTQIISDRVVEEVLKEREYQREKWTVEHDVQHTPLEWLAILATWVGKASAAAIRGDRAGFRKRLVQVAAICMAAVESFDRRIVYE